MHEFLLLTLLIQCCINTAASAAEPVLPWQESQQQQLRL